MQVTVQTYCNGLKSVSEIPLVLETTWSFLHTFFTVREVDLIVHSEKTCWFSYVKFIQARRKCGSLRCLLTCKFHRYRCSRAFLRILSKHGARGLEQNSQQYTEVLSLYSLVFISNRRVFIAQPSYWLINSYPVSGVQIVESAPVYYLKACNRLWSTLVFFYHSHRFLQRLPSVFTTHHSPLTIKTPWEEHF